MKTYFLFILFLLPLGLFAQQTGILERAIEFRGNNRNVSLFIPGDYNPSKKYQLILALHGFNQSSQQIRTVVQNALSDGQRIIICPDGNGSRHDDEFPDFENGYRVTQEIELLHTVLDSAFQWYSIESGNVVLTGFSYGGRESIYFGLQNYFKFKGIIALSPAIQSLDDVNNQLPIPHPQPFQFKNTNKIPTCICAGEQDMNFIEFIKAFSDQIGNDTLILNSAGHTTQYPGFDDDFTSCLDFIQRNANKQSTGLSNLKVIDLSIYPNPASDYLTVDFKQTFKGSVKIFSAQGRNYFHQVVQAEDRIIIPTSHLTGGTYIIQFTTENACQNYLHTIQ